MFSCHKERTGRLLLLLGRLQPGLDVEVVLPASPVGIVNNGAGPDVMRTRRNQEKASAKKILCKKLRDNGISYFGYDNVLVIVYNVREFFQGCVCVKFAFPVPASGSNIYWWCRNSQSGSDSVSSLKLGHSVCSRF